jgi:drug/metabolite transporter (DMT)-like permease
MRDVKYLLHRILLLLSTLFWGGTFVVVKQAVAAADPILFIGTRFLLAAIMLGLIFPRKLRRNLREALRPGFILGLLLTAGFITQTLGLQLTTATASGFITGLSIILVTVFEILMTRKSPGAPALAGVICGTVGLLLLSFRGGRLTFAAGDLLTLACAFAFAFHIALTGRFAPKCEPITLSTVQFAVVAVICLTYSLLSGHQSLEPLLNVWPAVVFTGIFASGLAFLFQTIAQRHVNTIQTAIILAAEPLFAALFARILLNEQAGWVLIVGGLLIVCGMILSALPQDFLRPHIHNS